MFTVIFHCSDRKSSNKTNNLGIQSSSSRLHEYERRESIRIQNSCFYCQQLFVAVLKRLLPLKYISPEAQCSGTQDTRKVHRPAFLGASVNTKKIVLLLLGNYTTKQIT